MRERVGGQNLLGLAKSREKRRGGGGDGDGGLGLLAISVLLTEFCITYGKRFHSQDSSTLKEMRQNKKKGHRKIYWKTNNRWI